MAFSKEIMGSPAAIAGVGVGLRHKHFKEVLEEKPEIPWLEVHSENFFKKGSAANKFLDKVREDYPLSAHSVGLSLCSAEDFDADHIAALKDFIARYQPGLISDHLSWSAYGGVYTNDLLPVPYTKEALHLAISKVSKLQEILGREILIENPSSYLTFKNSAMPEAEFLAELAKKSGCGILLDINNIYVSAHNHGFDALGYIKTIPQAKVKEIHLAGYSENEIEGKTILIDDHGSAVYDAVWDLFETAIGDFPDVPVLIERDNNIPPIKELMREAKKAEDIIKSKIRAAA